MTSPGSTSRVKARMLRAALEDNLDVIHGRLPRPLRPLRRRLQAWTRRVALAAAMTLALAAVARWPAAPAASAAPVRTPAVPAAAALRRPAARAPVFSESMAPAVLDLTVRRVVIDAGHGGANPGTSSTGGLKEKDVTLDIARQVQQLLATRGFDTVMTRTADETLSLRQRAATANERHGDIFVSIHLNWLQRPDARGIETYYLGPGRGAGPEAIAAMENQESGYSLSDMRALLEKIYADARRDESERLAMLVQHSLISALQKDEPDISDRGVKMAPFVVLGATEMPAILAEVSCLSNEEQAQRLETAEERRRIAEALVTGIQVFAHESRVNASERTGSHGR